MSLVKCRDKRNGITYVYESQSYWDKEKKQPRAHRKLIGKIDEETGEIVPTQGRGRKRKEHTEETPAAPAVSEAAAAPKIDYESLLRERDIQIAQLTDEVHRLNKRIDSILNSFDETLRCARISK